MQQRCSCGAVLPEDARFCHKCGKPQYEEDLARLKAQEAPSAPAAASAPPPLPASARISFKNSRAVWISLIVAFAAFICSGLAVLVSPALGLLVLIAAGFTAVLLYRGQSAEPVSPAAGARLGWMTGIWLFLAVAVMCALAALSISSPEGWQQAKMMWARFPQAASLMNLSQHEVLVELLMALPVVFFVVTLLPGLGGILGAKLLRRRLS